tara:strand:+ start:634 stop:1209 length:576 start_codon:yes stop_codon:yes gene_type:complete
MSLQRVELRIVSKEDVLEIQEWLRDDEVAEAWFGRYSYGDSAHLAYNPGKAASFSESKWKEVFEDSDHKIFSIYTDGEHIGEAHLAIEEALGDGQLSVLIGRKDLWHKGFGSSATSKIIKFGFDQLGLFRIWVDVPEYNKKAINLFRQLGFIHEGTLRQSRPHHGARFDSVVMGILKSEYFDSTVTNVSDI